MDYPPPQQKKGLGVLAWLGIGCGGIIALGIIGIAVFFMVYGGDFKKFAEESQKNPTRATAMMMVKMPGSMFELVAEDDVNKRYTVKEKSKGTLTTIYWNEKTQKPETVPGDFSAIPKDDAAPGAPAPVPQQQN